MGYSPINQPNSSNPRIKTPGASGLGGFVLVVVALGGCGGCGGGGLVLLLVGLPLCSYFYSRTRLVVTHLMTKTNCGY